MTLQQAYNRAARAADRAARAYRANPCDATHAAAWAASTAALEALIALRAARQTLELLMYRVIITRTDGSYCESMRFASLDDARAWAQWQEQTLGRKAQIIQ